MSAVLHLQPVRGNINGYSTKYSHWSAVHHPIVYQFQRKDFIVNSVVNSGGFIKIVCPSGSDLNNGDNIYLNCGPYNGTYTITTAGGSSAILDGAYISNASSGFMNNLTTRANYRLSVRIYWVNGLNTYELIGNARYYPDSSGILRVDVSAFVQRKSKLLNTCHYASVNEVEPTMGGSFNITHREDWIGSAESWTTLLSPLKNYYVKAARQLRDKYGSNLGEFVPFFDSDPTKARFLHLAGKPVYFPGFPFCIDFIYSELITGIDITREIQFRDVNGSLLSSESIALVMGQNQTLRVNHLMLPDPPNGCSRIDVWLQGDDSGTGGDDYVNVNYVASGYVQSRGNNNPPLNPTG